MRIYRLFFVLLLIGLFLAEFFHPITAINVDLGRHLLLGDIIVKTHEVPKTNLLSYTNKNFPYINTSWLTEVIYYVLFQIGGFNLLLLVNTLLIAFAFGILIVYSTKKYPFSIATLFSITLYLLLLSLRPDIRPEVMSMVCMSIFMVILLSHRNKQKINLLYLVPVELLWVNVHIYYFVGPVLIGLFLFDNLIIKKFQLSQTKMYCAALLGTVLALFINPNGIKGALFPFTVLQNYGFPVIENQSILTLFTTYHSSEILLPVFAIATLFIILFFARKNTQPIDWLLAVAFSIAAIIIFRNILLFIVATFPTYVTQLNFLSNKCWSVIKKLPTASYILYYPLSLLILLLLTVSCVSENGFGFGVTDYGKTAVDFLTAHHVQGPVYNNFDIGGYLSYRLYPQLVFVDNRPEAYPVSFFQKLYIPMQDNPEIFKKLDDHYHFNALVIEYWDSTPWGYPLLSYLVNDSHFKIVSLDPYTILLLRDTKKNKPLITHYLLTKKTLQITNVNNSQELIHYLFFFKKVGWKIQTNETLKLLRKTDPNLCILTHYPLEQTFLGTNHILTNCSLYSY